MNRPRGFLLLAVTAVGVWAGLTGAARAGYPGADGAITYSQNNSIYSIEAGKRSLLVAPDRGTSVHGAVWSPDGRKLAFTYEKFADHEGGAETFWLQVLDTVTGRATNVLRADGRPTWSPDGTQLALLCDRGICVYRLDGTLARTVPVAVPIVSRLAWSPDGRFGYIGKGFDNSPGYTRVWVENPDGSNAHPVTPDEGPADTFAWSPDGKQIAYTGQTHLMAIDANGENWHIVEDVNSNDVADPSWSPNGKQIVYVSSVDSNFHSGLVTIDPDGSNRHVLTDPTTGGPVTGGSPDWQRLPLRPTSVTQPSVTGSARVGQTLTATAGTWTGDAPLQYAYRWQRCSPSCADVGSTTATYAVTKADAGSQLRVVVSASNVAGSATAASAETVPVPQPSFTAVHARRVGTAVRLSFTVCDQSPAAVVVSATDWNLVSGHRRSTKRHSWTLGNGPGCQTAFHTWTAPHNGSHVVVVSARDGDGVSTRSLRLSLR